MNSKDLIETYKAKNDWRVKENSNTNFSFAGLQGYISESIISKYMLDEIYKGNISEAHRRNFIHLHDLGHGLTAYCHGSSLEELLLQGFNNDNRFIYANPSKHFSTACGHISNYIFTLSQEWAGAQAFSSIDTYLAPFVREDNLSFRQVKQSIQHMVFDLNNKYRIAMQSPFSNFTFDLVPPKDLKNKKVIVGGKKLDYCYKDCQKEMDMINLAFLEVMLEGDAMGKPFTFPIPTYHITKNFDWDCEVADKLFDLAGKTGLPYFSNFINSDSSPEDVRSFCCRLQISLKDIIKNSSGLFGSADKTGSIGVVTLNFSRIGYMSRRIAYDDKCYSQILNGFDKLNEEIDKIKSLDIDNEEKMIKIFYAFIYYFMDLGKESLIIKRQIVEENFKNGMYPYTKRYLDDYSNHFNTFGVNAGNECVLNMFGCTVFEEKGKRFLEEVLEKMLVKCGEYQEEYANYYENKGLLFNLEATPAEGTGSKFAIHDLRTFGNSIKTANGKQLNYYTNSTQIPQDMSDDIFDVLDNQDKLQTLYSSGTVIHLYFNQPIQSVETTKSLVKKIFTNYKLPYISISPNLCVCPIHGKLNGTYEYCPFDHTKEEIDSILKKGATVEDGKIIFH